MIPEFQQIIDRLSGYRYGALYLNGELVIGSEKMKEKDGRDIVVQSPALLDRNKVGMCHDATVYLDDTFTSLEIEHKCVYIASHRRPDFPTHSFVVALDKETNDWIIVDIFSGKDAACTAGSFKDPHDAIDRRVAAWIKTTNKYVPNVTVFISDHVPVESISLLDFAEKIMTSADEYVFNYGYVHMEYNHIGIYQALKNAARHDWKNIIDSEDISWLPDPPDYNGSYKSYFTLLGYRMFVKKVLPIVEKYLDSSRIFTEYVDFIDEKDIVYSDEFQVIIKRQSLKKFDKIYESIMELCWTSWNRF